MAATLIYITTASPHEADVIGRALIDSRLAACVNLLPGMTSMFHWEGRVEQATECVLIAKTRADLVPRLTDKVRELHGYDCPCVVAVPITDGNPAFLDWIARETARPGTA